MKCKNCGAEISNEEKKCPYCECEVIPDTSKEEANITCPNCGSKNIDFKREEIGSKKGKKTQDVLYRTVGICQDCGNTWETNSSDKKKKHGIGWWILAILFFPITLSIWFYKTDKVKLDKKYRIIILVVVWIILLVLGKFSPSESTTESTTDSTSPSIVITESVDDVDNTAANDSVETREDKITKQPATKETTLKPTTTKAAATTTTKPSVPLGKINALKKAQDYLAFSSFSYKGLIEQLEFEGFTNEEAKYGADNCDADWNEQAAKKAQSYLDYSSFSRDGLIEQLEFEGFTHEQALYGVQAVGY